jgi:hypothetical protein
VDTEIVIVAGRDLLPMKHKKKSGIIAALIAPCGMNCRLCMAYGRDKNPCPGCRGDDRGKAKTVVTCRIKKCRKIAERKAKYCCGCEDLPCDRLQHLDKRYRIKYGMSMIENLMHIEDRGIRRFVRDEGEKWSCPVCGVILCVHRPQCLSCGHTWR